MLYFYRHAILPKREQFVRNGALLCHILCAAIEVCERPVKGANWLLSWLGAGCSQ